MLSIKSTSGIYNSKKFSLGEIIINEKERGENELLIIISGRVLVVKNYQGENQTNVAILKAGDVYGENGLFRSLPLGETLIALEPVSVASVKKEGLLDFIRKNPALVAQLFEAMSAQTLGMEDEVLRVSKERDAIFAYCNADPGDFYRSMLFSPKHKTYNIPQPEDFKSYILPKEYACPCCEHKFTAPIVISTRLRPLGQMSCDFRYKYHGIEPLWFDVLSCPKCWFSAMSTFFINGGEINKKHFEKQLDGVKSRMTLVASEPRGIDQVFTSYYLALLCASGFEKHRQIRARLWLSLSWLYQDLGDRDAEVEAVKNAYECNKIVHSECYLPPENEQVTCMILGTLARRLGDFDAAMYYLYNARTVALGKPLYKQLAEKEAAAVSEQRKALK